MALPIIAAGGVAKKLFKGLRGAWKSRRSRRKREKSEARAEEFAQKEQEGAQMYAQSIGLNSSMQTNTPLTQAQSSIFDSPKSVLNENVSVAQMSEPMDIMSKIKVLPMWAKILGGIALLFVAFKLFTKKGRR